MDRTTVEWLMAPGIPPDPLAELEALLQRPAWHAQAACRGQGPTAFFSTAPAAVRAAGAVCGTCPVREPCQEYAAADPTVVGTWGGLTERDRRAVRRGAA